MMRQTKLGGSMTVFITCILILTLGLTGACLEYARSQAVGYEVQAGATAAAESVFAAYHAPLWDGYQLNARLIPDGDTAALEAETARYVSTWGQAESAAGGLTAFLPETVSWTDRVMMTDEGGAVFREMAVRAMLESAGSAAAAEWQNRLGLRGEGEVRDILQENSRKSTLRAGDIFRDYEEMKQAVSEEEEKLEEEKEQAEEAAEEQGEETAEEDPELAARDRERRRGKKVLRIISSVRSIVTGGILRAVLPPGKTASGAGIPSGGLPSRLPSGTRHRKVRSSGGHAENPVVFREYLMRQMRTFTSEGNAAVPRYELEYLIGGKSTDDANLKAAVVRMIWIRAGLNTLSLSRSASRQSVIRETAWIAVGWTGNAALTEAAAGLLAAAWSLAESLADVRILLDGGAVPLIKEDRDWHLTLENAADGWRHVSAASGSDRESGLTYEDYLRICLFFSSAETLSFRAMDVIQWNIRRVDGRFRMNHCMAEGNLAVRASHGMLFFPLYAFLRPSGRARVTVEKSSRFSYLNGT